MDIAKTIKNSMRMTNTWHYDDEVAVFESNYNLFEISSSTYLSCDLATNSIMRKDNFS